VHIEIYSGFARFALLLHASCSFSCRVGPAAGSFRSQVRRQNRNRRTDRKTWCNA